MPSGMDVQRLIAEVKKRPTLWDVRLPEYKDRTHTVRLWLEIAEAMGCDVEQCKRKWKNLRDAYRAEVRRTERRVQRLKLEGHADPQVSDSKWVYFQPMSFMNESKRKRYSSNAANTSSNDISNDSHEAYAIEVPEQVDMEGYCNVKMEPQTSTDDEADNRATADNDDTALIDDDEEANDMLFEQFKSVATPQAARRLSGTLTMGIGLGSNSPPLSMPETPVSAATSTALAPASSSNGSAGGSQVSNCKCSQRPEHHVHFLEDLEREEQQLIQQTPRREPNCKCSQRTEDQVHFLEDLEREEQQLMQSTRRDITRANTVPHFGDSDYNFLVSFLPQMKRLSELQNLQFRAKLSDLMLRIMEQPSTTVTTTIPSGSFGCNSMTTLCQQGHFDCETTTTMAKLQQKQQQQKL